MSKRQGRFSNRKLPHEANFSPVLHDFSDPWPERTAGYWEWFEKLCKEHPTPERLQFVNLKEQYPNGIPDEVIEESIKQHPISKTLLEEMKQ
jgi:hypothetical protein